MATADLDLSPALHDSFLRGVRSDGASGEASLFVEIAHINEFRGFPDGATFEIRFSDVQELIVIVARDRGRANNKWRLESAAWEEFERSFRGEPANPDKHHFEYGRYEVLQAQLTRDGETVRLCLDDIEDRRAFDAFAKELLDRLHIAAKHIEIVAPDGSICTPEEFRAIGETGTERGIT